MKKILTLIAFLPFAAIAQDYQYTSLRTMSNGSDGMSIREKSSTCDDMGTISMEDGALKINGTAYKLKPTRKDNEYRSGAYRFKLVYNEQKALEAVELYTYNTTNVFTIQKAEENMAVAKTAE